MILCEEDLVRFLLTISRSKFVSFNGKLQITKLHSFEPIWATYAH